MVSQLFILILCNPNNTQTTSDGIDLNQSLLPCPRVGATHCLHTPPSVSTHPRLSTEPLRTLTLSLCWMNSSIRSETLGLAPPTSLETGRTFWTTSSLLAAHTHTHTHTHTHLIIKGVVVGKTHIIYVENLSVELNELFCRETVTKVTHSRIS